MHIATEAVLNRLPRHSCMDCEKRANWCRGNTPLNGSEASMEFTRRLLPLARARVLADARERLS